MPTLATQFYSAFQQRDYRTMQQLYHPQATFSDPVFPDLDAGGVKAMWEMLLTQGRDLAVEFDILEEDEKGARVYWVATYTFSYTGRPVENRIHAQLTYADGKILRHEDRFSFWRWSRQALGPTGLLLGWTPWLKNKMRATAAKNLRRFRERPA